MIDLTRLGDDAVATKGWLPAHRFLILRRLSQLGILVLFLSGPLLGLWIVKGNLASSLTLELLPLTDPHVLLQAMLSGVVPENTALIGAAIVVLFYFAVGGRVYCAWVCPVNMVTDLADWLRRKLGLRGGSQLSRDARYWMLALTLALPLITAGGIVWELVNPVSILFRGIVFGIGAGWLLIAGLFLFDLLIAKRGWCGHLCPVGAFYKLLGVKSLLRVNAVNRSACNDCMECFVVCPEPHVIRPSLKRGNPVILSADCTNCGRCIDICAMHVFGFGGRHATESHAADSGESIHREIRIGSASQHSS